MLLQTPTLIVTMIQMIQQVGTDLNFDPDPNANQRISDWIWIRITAKYNRM